MQNGVTRKRHVQEGEQGFLGTPQGGRQAIFGMLQGGGQALVGMSAKLCVLVVLHSNNAQIWTYWTIII